MTDRPIFAIIWTSGKNSNKRIGWGAWRKPGCYRVAASVISGELPPLSFLSALAGTRNGAAKVGSNFPLETAFYGKCYFRLEN